MMTPFFFAFVGSLSGSLDPQSIPQQLALYDLYPDSPEGQKALQRAWTLLGGDNTITPQSLPGFPVDAIIGLVNKPRDATAPELSETNRNLINKVASRLPNRKLKGYEAQTSLEIQNLSSDQIDLSRALLLAQFGDDPSAWPKIYTYEAIIDLMALQVLARISMLDPPEVKINALNQLIFYEMQFRFPPHSTYAKDIDLYSFLPSVLDSQRGVCLGVSLLYLCLAQRINLPLEIVTPPGHIYVRYKDAVKEINIETTARGIDIPSEQYLGIETKALQKRSLKETIGMIHFNQASVFWKEELYEQAVVSYEKALPYLPEDKLLKELLAYQYLFVGRKEEGERLLKEVHGHIPDEGVSAESVADDYLSGKTDSDAIKVIYRHVDETRESILEKKALLEKTLEKWPEFRAGIFHLAVTWLQLHRSREALELLERYHRLDATDPSVEYYLSILYAQRENYKKSWDHLHQLEKLLAAQNHHPKTLKHFKNQLTMIYPESTIKK